MLRRGRRALKPAGRSGFCANNGNRNKTERSGGNTWTKRFWTAADLADKLRLFQDYFNRQRVHSGLEGRLPEPGEAKVPLNFASYRWQQHCRGLFQTPIAAWISGIRQ